MDVDCEGALLVDDGFEGAPLFDVEVGPNLLFVDEPDGCIFSTLYKLIAKSTEMLIFKIAYRLTCFCTSTTARTGGSRKGSNELGDNITKLASANLPNFFAKKIPPPMRPATAATPPTTPPAMIPIFDEL